MVTGSKLVGRLVYITDKESIYHGEWGVIDFFDGELYHVKIANGSNSVPVFDRKQIRIPRKEDETMTLKLSNNMVEIPLNPIRHARVKHGLTQQQMADLTGIPFRTIQNWEGGKRKCPDYVEQMVLGFLDQKFQKDYKGILEEVLDMLEGDLKHLKTDEAKTYVTNVIKDIKDSLEK